MVAKIKLPEEKISKSSLRQENNSIILNYNNYHKHKRN